MKLHSKGNDVQDLQNALAWLECMSFEDITGEFDIHTKESLREFQRQNGLPVTGEPDEETRRVMKQRLAEKG